MKALLKMKIKETAYNPGFYITVTIALVLSHFLIEGFVLCVESSGFNYAATPLYGFIGRTLNGIFGPAFTDRVFAAGPFLFSSAVSFALCFLFLSIISIFRFCFEKSTGVIEFVCCGPVDIRRYGTAVFFRDCLFLGISSGGIIIYNLTSAAAANLVFGPGDLVFSLILMAAGIVFFLYGNLLSMLASTAASALLSYLGVFALFLMVLTAGYADAAGYMGNLFQNVSRFLQWFSPLFYMQSAVKAFFFLRPLNLVLSFLALSALGGGIYGAVRMAGRGKGRFAE